MRYFADSARIQLSAAEFEKFIEQRKVIVQELKIFFGNSFGSGGAVMSESIVDILNAVREKNYLLKKRS